MFRYPDLPAFWAVPASFFLPQAAVNPTDLSNSASPSHGTQLPITPGMLVDADVELDRLKIYQWLLEPLFRLGARV